MNIVDLQQTLNLVTSALTPVAEKIGQSGAYIFSLYVKQAFWAGIVAVSFGIIGLIFWILIGIKWYSCLNKPHADSDICFTWAIIFLMYSLLVGIGGVGANLAINIPKIINPEYAAIDDIIWQVKR